uniref:Uncharacterized protein n=1 Tax=Arundo donax TaxID=35708 RepID=A0A0A9HUX2_ARUDO
MVWFVGCAGLTDDARRDPARSGPVIACMGVSERVKRDGTRGVTAVVQFSSLGVGGCFIDHCIDVLREHGYAFNS